MEGHLTQTIIVAGLFSSVCLFRLFKARGNFYRFCIPQSGPQRLNLSCGVPASYRGTEVLNILGLWAPENDWEPEELLFMLVIPISVCCDRTKLTLTFKILFL